MRTPSMPLDIIDRAKRLTIKIGTNSLIDVQEWQFKSDWFSTFIYQALQLKKELSFVSSGAIGLERARRKNLVSQDIAMKQGLAAIGQPELQRHYNEELSRHKKHGAQVLLTRQNLTDAEGLENTQSALRSIRTLGAIPVINENDTVHTEEIRFGDNDRLAAYTAHADNATTLILVTDVNGLYTADPSKYSDARHIPVVECLDTATMNLGKGANGNHSSGGMQTKLLAAYIAAARGIDTIIVNGQYPMCLRDLFNGKTDHATFIPHTAHPQLGLF